MRGPAQLATYLGVSMALVGFALIGLAWNGAAELDYIQGQFPYVLSGGLGGLGLIVAGMAVLGIQTQRTLTAKRAKDMRRLQERVDALLRLLVRPGPGEYVEDETIVDVAARTVVRTVERKPIESLPPTGGRDAAPAGGYAPTPRAPRSPTKEDPSHVAVLPRDLHRDGHDAREDDDAVWAPPAATGDAEAERQRIRELLADVSGVGPAKQRLLAERFGTVDALREATAEELAEVPGISPALGARIQAALR